MFEYMKITTLEAVFTARAGGRLPEYLGSTIRGILGHCFRHFVCSFPDKKCFVCDRRFDCSYVNSFANTGAEGGAVNPFVIEPCIFGKTVWRAGDDCTFRITLFGKAAEHPGIYLDAVKAMEERGWGAERIPFRLTRVTDWEQGRIIHAAGRSWLRNLSSHTMSVRQADARSVLIFFQTPVRIISGKKLFDSLPFPMFIRFLAGRLSLVTQVCTDFVLEWEQDKMLKEAAGIRIVDEHWDNVDFTRYSMNQKDGKLELPAKTGWVLYEGDLASYVPYLEAGRYLHVGKSTTIGFGKYDLHYDGGTP